MGNDYFSTLQQDIRQRLHTNAAFWLNHGLDHQYGGIYTCLDTSGAVYSTDKSVWMQGRAAWLFSALCARYGTRPEWLAAAQSCLDFLEAHCKNEAAGGRLYFTVTKEGRPLRQRRYCFSEAFFAMANAEFSALTASKPHLENARQAWETIYTLNNGLAPDPVGLPPKTDPATRACRSLADPMIYLNLTTVLHRCDPANTAAYLTRAHEAAQQIVGLHHKPQLRATLETVGTDGAFLNEVSAGRVVNPGHSLECSWFLMDHALATEDNTLLHTALEMTDFALERGWDEAYGGLLYFTDVLGHPPEAYEHDMKLWWPHNEMLIATLKAYSITRDEKYLAWFQKGWQYATKAFPFGDTGEWYGYLRRGGKPTLPAALGSTFKGPFHLPRMLLLLDEILESLL